MLTEELFNKTPERLAAVVLLQQLHSGVQVGEIFHAVQDSEKAGGLIASKIKAGNLIEVTGFYSSM